MLEGKQSQRSCKRGGQLHSSFAHFLHWTFSIICTPGRLVGFTDGAMHGELTKGRLPGFWFSEKHSCSVGNFHLSYFTLARRKKPLHRHKVSGHSMHLGGQVLGHASLFFSLSGHGLGNQRSAGLSL